MERRDKPQSNKPTPRSTVLLEKLNSSARQAIPRTLWNLGVYYRVHNSPTLAPILSQVNPVRTLPTASFKIHSNVILPPTPRSSKLSLALTFPHRNPLCTAPLSHLVLDWSLGYISVRSTNNEADHPRRVDKRKLRGIMWPAVSTLQI